MTKISLRTYFKNIEALINEGSNDEAIRHCRYILKLYPKCIDAYRDLAKALLEKKEYAEAKDIFSRILSVYPDDFVSHIGLSIIRETEGDLDAAIWHMELAYDIQPSNPVLTEELRRLFGRRDGIQPPKIRMTRGALIRMYARGELYQQVISECQSVLAEDPQRIDIEVILARMLFQSSALAESAEICNKIINKIPYCYEANHLMTQIIARTGQTDAALAYRLRLAELDPYFSHTTSPEMNSSDIPDSAITMDVLDESAKSDSFETPHWSKVDEFTWEDTQPLAVAKPEEIAEVESKEDPLLAYSKTTDASALDSSSLDTESNQQDESFQKKINALDKDTGALYNPQEIPEWILNAGWKSPGASADEQLDNSSLSAENVNVSSDDAEPAILPEWLNHTEPSESNAPGTDNASLFSVQGPIGNPETNLAEVGGSNKEDEQPESSTALPGQDLQNSIPEKGETGEIMPPDTSNKNEDEWLNQFREDGPSSKENQNDLPDWLKDFESENEQPLEGNMDIPDWLKSLEPEEPAQSTPGEMEQPIEPVQPAEATAPAEEPGAAVTSTSYVFTKMLPENEARSANLETTMLQPETETPAVSEPAVTQPTPVPDAVKPAPEASSGLPSWVRNILKPQSQPVPPVESPVEEVPAALEASLPVEPVIASEPPEVPALEFAQEATPPEIPSAGVANVVEESTGKFGEEPIHDLSTAASAEGAISSETSSELLDWLRGFGENEDQPAEAPTPIAEEESVTEPAEGFPVERIESFAESAAIDVSVPLPEFAEVSALAEEPVIQPVSEEPVHPAAEEIETAQPDSWFEENLREPVSSAPIDTGEMESAEVESLEAEEFTSASEVVDLQPIEEQTISPEPEPIEVIEEEIPAHPIIPEPLSVAKNALEQGDLNLAVNELNMALQDETKLPELIDLLKTATFSHDQSPDLWMLLGDAYARTNQFGDAFTAYDRVETLLLKP